MNPEKKGKKRLWFVLGHCLVFFACIAISLVIWLVVNYVTADAAVREGDPVASAPVLSDSSVVL